MTNRSAESRRPWTREEVEAVVADYFHMLTLELTGQQYNKSEHRRALLMRLEQRTEGAVELKHQNISAMLIELGMPWIIGYKPMKNYQSALFDVVAARLSSDGDLDTAAQNAVERPAVTPRIVGLDDVVVAPPQVRRVSDTKPARPTTARSGVKRDYLALETLNRSLGAAGETYVVQFEQQRLHSVGATKLADRVEQVSRTKGDGLGYDILSFDTAGREKWIEVKTTTFGLQAPFFVSRRELEVSKHEPDKFHLYRLFEFRDRPRMFQLKGPVDRHCILDPISYRARF